MSASASWTRREAALLLALGVLAASFGALSPEFRSPAALLDQSRYMVEVGILAPFAFLVIAAGGIDLSVASILALCGVAIVRLHCEEGMPMALAALLGLCIGAAAGALNGALIALGRIPDLVVTLATMAIFRGLAQAVQQNRVHSNLPPGYRFLGEELLFGIVPVQWIILLAVWAAAYVLLHRTWIGRCVYAAGSSAPAARFARIPTAALRIGLYSLSGLAAGLAAIVYTARSNTAKSDDALGFELEAITCVVLGGASISGGRGNMAGLFLAFLAIGVLRTGLVFLDVSELRQKILTGAILIAMAALNERLAARRRLREAR